jgi:tRNA modification GTPase
MTGRQTIAAIATSQGKGGIGVVRVSGKDSLEIAKTVSKKSEITPRHAHFSSFTDSQNRIIDQGVLIYFNAPNSFTGEDVVEFQGHSGSVVLNILLKEVLFCGARLARPGEFTERAYLNEKMDLVQAEAVADLIDSVSEQAARSAARSLDGEFSNKIHLLVDDLIKIRVIVEGALDFPEEDIEIINESGLTGKLKIIISTIDQLLLSTTAGRKLREGIRTVIAGMPNVGKSSLLNRLVGADRAIVTDIAGTTRDVIEDTIVIDGLAVNIVDTAGLRVPEGQVEAEGIKRSVKEIKKADIVIYVTDKIKLDHEDYCWIENTGISGEQLIVLHNKIDLNNEKPGKIFLEDIAHVFASMKDGAGLNELEETIKNFSHIDLGNENIILARERHIQALKLAKQGLESAMSLLLSSVQGEIVAEELRRAQQVLAEITGEVHSDELLGEIFSRFCIGK